MTTLHDKDAPPLVGIVRPASGWAQAARFMATWGPGLLVMIADTDPGNVVTAAQGGAAWGYRLLPLLLLLIVPLYMVQELTIRLGIFARRGFTQMVREEFGRGWAFCAVATLLLAAFGSLVTEFTGVAGVGELYGISHPVSLAAAAVFVVIVALSGSYRRIERAALVIGAFEAAFFVVAWQAGPSAGQLAHDLADLSIGNPDFGLLAAAVVGASFNPWMVFYQQSAVVERKLGPEHYRAARWDTGIGAVLTQCLSAAVLVAAAATLGRKDIGVTLTSVAQVFDAFADVSPHMSRLVFSMGVLGAALVAVIVSSLAVGWGLGEALGLRHGNGGGQVATSRWFGVGYVLAVVVSAVVVGVSHDLIWLNIDVQVANAILLPMVFGLLVALATRPFLGEHRLKGVALVAVAACSSAAVVAGLLGILTFLTG